MTNTTTTRNVILMMQTFSGIEFKIFDANTRQPILGPDLWCSLDAEELEDGEFDKIVEAGWNFWREWLAGAGWTVVEEITA